MTPGRLGLASFLLIRSTLILWKGGPLWRENAIILRRPYSFSLNRNRHSAGPVYEADRHAKKELKKHIRGVRPIERSLAQRKDMEAEVIRGYCLAALEEKFLQQRLPM